MLRIVKDVPGTKVELSRVSLIGLSAEERQKTVDWLNEVGASIADVSAEHVAYYL